VAEVEDAIAQHVENAHLGLSKAEVTKVFEEHYSMLENGRKLDLIIDDYFGPPRCDIDGEVHRDGGTKEVMAEFIKASTKFQIAAAPAIASNERRLGAVEHAMENGGMPARLKLTKGQGVAVGVALAPVLAASISVLFG